MKEAIFAFIAVAFAMAVITVHVWDAIDREFENQERMIERHTDRVTQIMNDNNNNGTFY